MLQKNKLNLPARVAMVVAMVLVAVLATACGGGSGNTATADASPEAATTPAAIGDCLSATVTWIVAGKTCSAISPITATGASALATDVGAPTFGSASFLCTNAKLAASPSAASASTCLEPTVQKARLSGNISTSRGALASSFNAGHSIYTAAWPILNKYPGNTFEVNPANNFQSGLFSTWMFAKYPEGFPKGIEPNNRFYSDIEGGLGWWGGQRFPTETPKFKMGGVALNFSMIADGPGQGGGGWEDAATPYGLYGVAQLSPRLLFPPDGLNLKQGTNGELFGYGYLPLPFTEPKLKTAGKDVPTGDNSWTLFLNTENFKGPLAFFTPYFWSRASALGITDINGKLVDLSGKFLDSRGADPEKPWDIENAGMPGYMSTDSKSVTYARIAPVSFPSDANGNSVVLHRHIAYNKNALWTSVQDWFKNGKAASGVVDMKESSEMTYSNDGGSTFTLCPLGRDDLRYPINWDSFAKRIAINTTTYGFRWDTQLTSKTGTVNNPMVTLPEYFRFDKDTPKGPTWVAVQPRDVPSETGLKTVEFKRALPQNPPAYTTPLDDARFVNTAASWKTPGPAKGAGPFKAQLGDGSTVTYYWYRFADQPALLNADLTAAEREQLQLRVEKLHKSWKIDQNYLPGPTTGKLASLDPKLVVTPPAGLEFGYVPIVTRQEKTP
jgi:hypothetical protein